MFSRLNDKCPDLAPLNLPASVPEAPPMKINMSKYDSLLNGGGSVED